MRAAAVEVKRQLLGIAAEELKLSDSDLAFNGDEIASRSDPAKKVAVAGMTGLRRRGLVVGIGYRGPNPQDKVTCPFAAQFCEVEVNTRTGEVKVLRFLGAHDSGRVMDRLTYDNQVHRRDHDGDRVRAHRGAPARSRSDRQDGQPQLARLQAADDAGRARRHRIACRSSSSDAEANTAGAKGLGEPVTIPTAPAVANAVYHATGVRMTETPMHPQRVLERLAAPRKEG